MRFQSRRIIPQSQLTFSTNGQASYTFRKKNLGTQLLHIYLSETITNSHATEASNFIAGKDNEHELLKTIRLSSEKEGEFYRVSARNLKYLNYFFRKTTTYTNFPATIAAAGGTGLIEQHCVIPLELFWSNNNHLLSAYDYNTWGDLQLTIEFGSLANVYSGGTLSSLNGKSITLIEDEIELIPSSFDGSLLQIVRQSLYDTSTSEKTEDLDTTDMLQAILIRVRTSSTNEAPVDNLDTIKLFSGSVIYKDLNSKSIKGEMPDVYEQSNQTGIYILNFDNEKNLTNIIPAMNLATLKLSHKSTASNNLDITLLKIKA